MKTVREWAEEMELYGPDDDFLTFATDIITRAQAEARQEEAERWATGLCSTHPDPKPACTVCNAKWTLEELIRRARRAEREACVKLVEPERGDDYPPCCEAVLGYKVAALLAREETP